MGKRLPSRQSNTNFTIIDFDYKGNASEIAHMLKPRECQGSPNLGQVKFELGLRRYQGSNHRRPPWKYLPTMKSKEQLHDSPSKSPQNATKNQENSKDREKYIDKFREANMNQFRELLRSKLDLKSL